MFVLMVISFFTARITLNALGVEDYGINNVVGGLVTVFSLFSNSMTAATSRFITCALGEENEEKLNKIFSTTVNLHLTLTIFIVVLLELGGIWFLNNKLLIPADKMHAANWVFQCSVLGFAVNLMSIPYNACIIAQERMSAFAYMTIIDGFFKFVVAFSIYYYRGDRLILYAVLGLLFTMINRYIYYIYCKRNFKECTYRWIWDANLNKKIFNFSGWNFIGASSGVLRDHGVNILLNLFCGPSVNAARGITMQISGIVTQFAQNFMTALNPQITKSYAAGDKGRAIHLVFQGSRFSFYLLFFISLPLIIETNFILHTWLGVVPDYSAIFVRLMLIYTLVESLSYTMVTLMLATGNIRNYQIVVGGCQLLNFPLSYLFLNLGFNPSITIIISISIAFLCMLLRFVLLWKMVRFPYWNFIKSVLFNVVIVSVVAFPFPFFIILFMEEGWYRFALVGFTCLIFGGISIYYIGCSLQERLFVIHYIKNKLSYATRNNTV